MPSAFLPRVLRLIDLPPVWLTAAAAAAWALDAAVPLARMAPPAWTAAAPAALGAGLILWTAALFFRARTPIEPRHSPSEFLRTGPFRLNRNPIYTGMALILLGWALHLGAVSALALPPLWLLLIDRRFVRGEEAALRAAFGAEAEDWLARTRRW